MKDNTKDNNIMNIIEPAKVGIEDLESIVETEEMDEGIEYSLLEGSEQVPLDPMILPEEFILQIEGFVKGMENVAELAGEISLLSSVGVTPQMYIQLYFQDKENKAAMEMNKEIAKMNVEASKNIKKEIEKKNEDSSL